MDGRKIYEFDRFRLNPRERRLFHAGAPIALTPKTLDTLIALVESGGNLLHKEVLHQLLWPDTFVEDVTLARNISDLRAVLGQYSAAKYIETVPKHGYRFIGTVHATDDAYVVSSSNSEPMVAVLPFTPFDSDIAVQILGDGLAEEIIHALSCFSGLKVAARGSCFRFRGSAHDLKKIAADLGTDFIVQGSVRRLDSRFRVTAQVVEAQRLTVRWSEQFEREVGDFLEIQDSIAKAIVADLKPRLHQSNFEIVTSRHARQTDAWHSLWEGRLHQHRFTPDSLAHAEMCFEKAIRLDPDYALGYLGIAENQHIKANLALARPIDVLPKAADAISKALLLESNSGEVHAAAGVNAVFWCYDWAKAELHFGRALTLSPSSSSVHHLYALWWLRPQGRLEEAIYENQHALALDPLSPFLRIVQAYLLYLAGNEIEAVSLCTAALSFDGQSYLGHRIMGHIWQRQGKTYEANRAYAMAVELSGSSLIDLGYFAASCALIGDTDNAVRIGKQLEESLARGYLPSTIMAIIDLCSGRSGRANTWVEKAIEEHDPNIFGLATDPVWTAMRGSPEYRTALSRIGLSTKKSSVSPAGSG
jgi:TolB-like protein/tetratricopeptide (TPR) repeat protein